MDAFTKYTSETMAGAGSDDGGDTESIVSTNESMTSDENASLSAQDLDLGTEGSVTDAGTELGSATDDAGSAMGTDLGTDVTSVVSGGEDGATETGTGTGTGSQEGDGTTTDDDDDESYYVSTVGRNEKIRHPPDPPIGLFAEPIGYTASAKVSWTPGDNNGTPIVDYLLEWHTGEGYKHSVARKQWLVVDDTYGDMEATMVSLQLDELDREARYRFRIQARNFGGLSEWEDGELDLRFPEIPEYSRWERGKMRLKEKVKPGYVMPWYAKKKKTSGSWGEMAHGAPQAGEARGNVPRAMSQESGET